MKVSKLLALLAVMAIVVAACGPGEVADTTAPEDGATTEATDTTAATDTTEPAVTGAAGEGGNLLLLQWQAPSQANSYLSTGTKDLLAGSLVLEPLVEFDPEGNPVPVLAAEIPTQENGGISEDLTQITYTLKEGVMWSDGTPLTANDVVFSWEYCSDEATGCSADSFVSVASVEAVDDLTVTITFDGPQPYPFIPFSAYTSPVIQQAQFADCIGAAAKACTEQNFAPIGTGPYMVTELRPEDTVLYEANPNYRGAADGQPFFGTVEIKGGGDAEAAARSVLEIGEADYAWNLQVAPEILLPMEAAGNGTVFVSFGSSVEAIRLNQTDPDADPPSEYQGEPTDPTGGMNPYFYQNDILHRALSMAINRDELTAVGYGETGEPACTNWPVGDEATTSFDDFCLTQDIEGANALLDENGYVDTDGDGVRETPDGEPLSWVFKTSTNAVRQSFQDLISGYWEQIGVETDMQNVDASLFFDGTCASDDCIWKFFQDVEMYTSSSSGPDFVGYYQGNTCDQIPTSANNWGGGNIERYCNPEFDALIAELGQMALEDPGRIDLIHQAQDMLNSTAVLALVNRGTVSAFANSIQGVGTLNPWDSEYWNIEEWTRSE
ncbi:MAG: peptide ABC transporter substrate-binding protein [Actinobacteria bacterium]|nr:peptide ABC transporter substrate-binding protein [Actinomycetota bacterium]